MSNTVAIPRNWTPEARADGNSWIDIIVSGESREAVTVAIGQTARDALAVAGWEVRSQARKTDRGQYSVLVERGHLVSRTARLSH